MEFSCSELSPIEEHMETLNRIVEAQKKKMEAAMEEDFEAALEWKKKIVSYESTLLTVDKVESDFLSKRPLMTT